MEESRRHLEHVEDIAELRGIDELAKIDLSNSVQFQVRHANLANAVL